MNLTEPAECIGLAQASPSRSSRQARGLHTASVHCAIVTLRARGVHLILTPVSVSLP
jgi:hypothetical protein